MVETAPGQVYQALADAIEAHRASRPEWVAEIDLEEASVGHLIDAVIGNVEAQFGGSVVRVAAGGKLQVGDFRSASIRAAEAIEHADRGSCRTQIFELNLPPTKNTLWTES